MDALHRRLSQLIFTYWQIPEREGRLLLKVLARSSVHRAMVLRHHFAVIQTTYPTRQGMKEADLHYVFTQVLTPPFMLGLVQDLESAGGLTHQQAVVIEDAMLEAVDASGHWRAVEGAGRVSRDKL